MATSPIYTLEIEGEEYEFCDDKITASELRHIKRWFPGLGTYAALRVGYLTGDPDALAAVRWIVRAQNKIQPNPEPNRAPDFNVGEFMNSFMSDANERCEACEGRGWNAKVADDAEPDAAPLEVPATSPTWTPEARPETPTNSETSTFPSSDTSAT